LLDSGEREKGKKKKKLGEHLREQRKGQKKKKTLSGSKRKKKPFRS